VNSRAARIALVVLGVVALVVGLVWVGQGSNLIPGSFMTGSRTWLTVGLIVAVVGIVLVVVGLRRPAERRRNR
jgi:hypothetical protein